MRIKNYVNPFLKIWKKLKFLKRLYSHKNYCFKNMYYNMITICSNKPKIIALYFNWLLHNNNIIKKLSCIELQNMKNNSLLNISIAVRFKHLAFVIIKK